MSRLPRALAATVVCALGAAAVVALPATAALAAEPGIRINEVESSGGDPGDWIELYNPTDAPIVLDGFTVKDSKDSPSYVIPTGTTVAAGGYLVLDELLDSGEGQLPFGLGGGDQARLFDATGALVDEYTWTAHAATTWGVAPDGGWAPTDAATKGAANTFADPEEPEEPAPAGEIVINEVDSQPSDWVEFFNPGTAPLDISGYEIRDNSDDHRWQFLPGTTIAAGAYLVVDQNTIGTVDGTPQKFSAPIGIGSADRIRLYDATGTQLDDTLPWNGHAAIDGDAAAATLARCPDGEGAFVLAYATPGAANECVLPAVVINEIESNGDATDWVEVVNTGATAVDMSGWSLMDSDPVGHAAETTPLPAGTTLAPGAYFVFDQYVNFTFGLGGGDTVTVRDAAGATVAEHAYTAHAKGVWARCADGSGDLADVAVSTKGQRNACGNPVRINEVETDGGSPDDWVELVNPTAATLDVSGIVVKDDDDAHAYAIPAETTIAAGGYLVIDDLGFGLGKGDAVRLFDGDLVIDETAWGADHAATTWGRCPDTTGAFAVTAEPTKGAANVCAGEIPVGPWPGAADVTVLDETPTFLEDSSGLDTQTTAAGTFLWAVDNGTGAFWKLAVAADGSTTFVPGWEQGKRARLQKDAADPSAAGPDTEGITVADDGYVYLAVERDNSAKDVNRNLVLQLDPNAAGPDVVATREWDLTALLPAVGANLGMEAVEWVADGDLAAKLYDDRTQAPYDPADYPDHGNGLFFVAVEDTGDLYAFALTPAGGATLVATIDPGLAGVMALDYDTALDVMWAVCDDGCGGAAAQVALNGTSEPGIAHVARPAGMPNLNNEGFATLPGALAGGVERPAWWFADGVTSAALRLGTLPAVGGPTGPTTPGLPGGPGTPTLPETGGSGAPLPGTALVDANRGGILAPATARAGGRITVSAGAPHAGTPVTVWLYSTPMQIGAGTLDASGRIVVTIPADAPLGDHRLAVYAADGELIGWTGIRITGGALAATGGSSADGALLLAVLLLLAGGAVAVGARRRA